MNRPRLVVHGHFYQPLRLDPFSGTVPADPTAAPARDWNERIASDCYRPNAELGNLGTISWDLGPTLAGWLRTEDPATHDAFVAGDRGINGMAQPFHHTILPLASAADRRTEIRWGLRDFRVRFGRIPTGMWLPETAVDVATLRLLADEGVTHTILAPWQVRGHDLDTRRPVRLELGDGRAMVVALYDGLLSAAVSFESEATVDADRFARDRLLPRFAQPYLTDDAAPLVLIATDGELYGHHQPMREHFLARLAGATAPPASERGYDVVPLAAALADDAAGARPATGTPHERTSWSCHHGVDRWKAHCDCVDDGHWKGPLRSSLDRLAGAVDALTDRLARDLPGAPDPWAARDDYVDVVVGLETPTAFASERLGRAASGTQLATFATLMEAQRWRLAMFASCGWFWDDPIRPETAGVLRAASRAARLIDGLAGTDVETRLAADLGLVIGPGGDTGEAIRRSALAAVDQA
jgi:hypothetical protein